MSNVDQPAYDGLSLSGRMMRHIPWLADASGNVPRRGAGGPEPAFPISGEALRESLLFFMSAGGDGDALVALLNRHAPPTHRISLDGLLDGGRSYGAEYYLYFNLFMKELRGDFGFRFDGDGAGPLSRHHRCYEAGRLRDAPWGSDANGDAVRGLGSINFLYTLRYIKEELREDIGELLGWLNRFSPPGWEVDEAFIFSDEAPHRYSYSYTITLMALAEAYCNDASFLRPAFQKYIADETSSVFGGFLNCSPRKAFDSLIAYRDSMSPAYRDSLSVTPFSVRMRTLVKDAKYIEALGRYRLSLMDLGLFIHVGGNLGILGHLMDAPLALRRASSFCEGPDTMGYVMEFRRLVDWRLVASTAPLAVLACAAALAALVPDLPLALRAAAAAIVGSGGFGVGLLLRRSRLLERKLEESRAHFSSQFRLLAKANQALAAERATLAERVKSRTVELAAANLRLQELDKAKTDFLLNVSHELRTPLTLILVNLEAIRRGRYGASLPAGHEAIAVMERNGRRLLDQVDTLLAFAQIDRQALDVRLGPIDIAESCRELAAEFPEAASRRRIRLVVDCPEAPVHASLDRRLWERIFLNLLSNALKFTPDGGDVRVGLRVEGDRAILSVRDTGIGIDPERLPRIFDRFYQVDSSRTREREGVGLGLALVKEACGILGIGIEAESAPGAGSEFRLSLRTVSALGSTAPRDPPLGSGAIGAEASADRRLDPAESPTPRGPLTASQPDGTSAPILIVEDNPDMARFLAELLSSDFQICLASNGREALQLSAGRRFGLVLTDVMMPVMDGRTLLEEWRGREGGDATPFLFLTARASETERLETLRAGAIGYLLKPFSSDELMAGIGSLLAVAEAQRERERKDLERRVLTALSVPEGRDAPGTAAGLESLGLTSRELEVVNLVAEGLANKEIGARLSISAHRVANILSEVFRKTGCASRAQLARLAVHRSMSAEATARR